MEIQPDPKDTRRWNVVADHGTFATLKKLSTSYGIASDAARAWWLESPEGSKVSLERWLRDNDAYSVSFSDPEYFYSIGSLYRKAGFDQEAKRVKALLKPHAPLDHAASEKGPTDEYRVTTTNFSADSIFRVLETSLAGDALHLCCGDLGDEWADYLAIGPGEITFFHCKDGTPTTGASDFQIVVGQAVKNLSRIKFRPEEIQAKLGACKSNPYWANTRIPRLAKTANHWDGCIAAATAMTGNPAAVWRVALVVTALSDADFEREMQRTSPKPHFIQLVWLLSAFASICRERDAQPIIYCRT